MANTTLDKCSVKCHCQKIGVLVVYFEANMMEFIESFSLDEEECENETAMMRSILANTVHAEELVIINKCSIKGHRVSNRNRAWGHLMLVDNYIAPDAPCQPYFHGHFRMR